MTKYGLIIGISYTGTERHLPGTINDVQTMKSQLKEWNFYDYNVMVLSEKSGIQPTGFNITKAFSDFCIKLAPGDTGIIYYSGHGSRVKSKMFQEAETCIVPLDHHKTGMINSETIRYYLNKITSGVNVLCVFDSCNSGSICDLKYHIYDTSYRNDITVKLNRFDYNEWILRQNINELETRHGMKLIDTNANIVSISGCWDDQYSYDLGKNGALTYIFLSILKKYSLQTLKLKHLLQDVRGGIISLRLFQNPQMMFGKNIDTNILLKDFLNL